MPRKGFVSRREVAPDTVYGSQLVQKFINSMMWEGKRNTAQRVFYTAMEQVGKK
ncbi:MAG: 30S ribosomal protein S7, partial [Candidatus Acidiferrales bacterium]